MMMRRRRMMDFRHRRDSSMERKEPVQRGVTTLGTLEKDFPALSYVTATSHIGPFKLNHIELKFRSLVTLAIFQVLERYM